MPPAPIREACPGVAHGVSRFGERQGRSCKMALADRWDPGTDQYRISLLVVDKTVLAAAYSTFQARSNGLWELSDAFTRWQHVGGPGGGAQGSLSTALC